MPSPMVVIPQLEGYLSTLVNSGVTPATAAGINTLMFEPVFEWVNVMKRLMRQPGNRDLTTWAMAADGDLVNASTSGLLYTGAAVVYGALIGTIENGNTEVVTLVDTVNLITADNTAADDALVRAKVWMSAAAAAANREYHGVVWEAGIPIATGISFCADGAGGAAPTANDISIVCLYRTA